MKKRVGLMVTLWLGAWRCGADLEAYHSRRIWEDLEIMEITAPVRVESVSALGPYSAPARCPGGGRIVSSTMHTRASAQHGGEVTAYVQYALRDCQPRRRGPRYSGTLRRATQHRFLAADPALGQPADYSAGYDHFSGELDVHGEPSGHCAVDLHRRAAAEPSGAPTFEGSLCGHAAAAILSDAAAR
jgi:hypothetical protein